MRFGFNYGVGKGSARYRNSFLVSYLMDTVYTDGAMDRFLDNVGSYGSNNDAVAYASNHIYLNGTTQSVPYPVLHELGSETITSTLLNLTSGDSTITAITNGSNIVDTTSNINTFNIQLNGLLDDAIVRFTFDAVVNSGAMTIESFFLDSAYVPLASPYTVVNGANVIEVEIDTSGDRMYFKDGLGTYDVDIINPSVKEITLPTASYLTILQADGTIKQLSSTGDRGEEIFSDDVTSQGAGLTVTGSTPSWTISSTASVNDALKLLCNTSLPYTKTKVIFTASNIVGSPTITTYYDGTQHHTINHTVVEGINTIDVTVREGGTGVWLYGIALNHPIAFDMSDTTVKQGIPVSTTYSVTDSHQFVFSHTSPLSASDISAIEADPNLAFRMFMDGEILPSGFSNTDVGWFSGGNEGLASGAYVQDLSEALGLEATTDMPSDAIWGDEIGTYTKISANSFDLAVTTTGTITNRPSVAPTYNSMDATLHILIFDVVVNSGTPILKNLYDGAQNINLDLTLTTGTHVIFINKSITGTLLIMYFRGDLFEFDISISNWSVREASAVEIEAYDEATRTTLDNQPNGASNLKLIQDGSGRTTGIAVANTTQWKADGRTAVTNWTITAPFTITEEIDGDTYDFTSDGNRYKNTIADGTYTLPTGVWTLDEFGFDGVTPVTVRGKTSMVDEVIIP